MTGERVGGGSDGLHTGGAWFYQNKVWKPLDGRGYANSPIHIETQEEECLVALQGKPLFPKNWEVREQNGRRFIIRDKVQTFPGGGLVPTLKQVEEIQRGIREMNQAGWSINDDIVFGKDRNGKLFIIDLSNASYSSTKTGPTKPDDSQHMDVVFKQAGFGKIVELKKLAVVMRVTLVFSRDFKTIADKTRYRWVYTSDKNIEVKDAVNISSLIKDLQPAEQAEAKKYFWYISKQELPQSVVATKNLKLRAF
jgi:hypothetical protein